MYERILVQLCLLRKALGRIERQNLWNRADWLVEYLKHCQILQKWTKGSPINLVPRKVSIKKIHWGVQVKNPPLWIDNFFWYSLRTRSQRRNSWRDWGVWNQRWDPREGRRNQDQRRGWKAKVGFLEASALIKRKGYWGKYRQKIAYLCACWLLFPNRAIIMQDSLIWNSNCVCRRKARTSRPFRNSRTCGEVLEPSQCFLY